MTQDDARPLTRNLAPFGVRMPPDLKERVEASAKANNRSINAEIVATLEEKYPNIDHTWLALITTAKSELAKLLRVVPEFQKDHDVLNAILESADLNLAARAC